MCIPPEWVDDMTCVGDFYPEINWFLDPSARLVNPIPDALSHRDRRPFNPGVSDSELSARNYRCESIWDLALASPATRCWYPSIADSGSESVTSDHPSHLVTNHGDHPSNWWQMRGQRSEGSCKLAVDGCWTTDGWRRWAGNTWVGGRVAWWPISLHGVYFDELQGTCVQSENLSPQLSEDRNCNESLVCGLNGYTHRQIHSALRGHEFFLIPPKWWPFGVLDYPMPLRVHRYLPCIILPLIYIVY